MLVSTKQYRAWLFSAVVLSVAGSWTTLVAEEVDTPAEGSFQINRAVLQDKIRGGLLGQIIGNLNGLPHEFKYIAEPGRVENYVPSLPDGARTDDDTDLEWVYVTEMSRSGEIYLPPSQIVQLWKRHINQGIWCANRCARDLMELGVEPPLTGNQLLNPWAEFNISGQFVCESFGLVSPAMPQTAARIGLHYTRVTIDGEPAQSTRLFTAMIATAFRENNIDRILDAGVASVDPESEIAAIVQHTRRLCRDNPNDWRETRKGIQERWQKDGGSFRDQNGYELNTACTIAALVYGDGDFVKTLELAFNLGWDCDNNAATAATILGVMRGRRWMDAQGWDIADVYKNTTREGMPRDETISKFENRLIECAHLVIIQQGGEELVVDGAPVYRIRSEQPSNAEPVAGEKGTNSETRRELIARIESDLGAESVDGARAAYIAICLGEAERLQRERPDDWQIAIAKLREFNGVVRNLFDAPRAAAGELQDRAKQFGVQPST